MEASRAAALNGAGGCAGGPGSIQGANAQQGSRAVSELSVMAANGSQVDIERCIIQAHYGASGFANDDEVEWLHIPVDWPVQQRGMAAGRPSPAEASGICAEETRLPVLQRAAAQRGKGVHRVLPREPVVRRW